jgi:hypothetical protein
MLKVSNSLNMNSTSSDQTAQTPSSKGVGVYTATYNSPLVHLLVCSLFDEADAYMVNSEDVILNEKEVDRLYREFGGDKASKKVAAGVPLDCAFDFPAIYDWAQETLERLYAIPEVVIETLSDEDISEILQVIIEVSSD